MTKKDQTFNCKFEMKDIKENGDIGIVEGLASTFGNTDRVGDVIVEGAFSESIQDIKGSKGHIPMLFQHDSRKVIGKFRAKDMKETTQGLFVKGEINLKTNLGKDTFELLKTEDISDFSIGFRIRESHFDDVDRVTRLEEIDLREISIVTFPCNEEAIVTGIKSVISFQDLPVLTNDEGEPNARHEWDSEKAIKNIKALELSDDDYKNNFLYCTDDKEYGPIVDVIKDEVIVIPRALFTAVGEIVSGKSIIPDEQVAKVTRNIERYYEKMGFESPFKKGLGRNELSRMSPKQIKSYMRDNGFSVAGAEYVSNMVNKGIKSLSNSGGTGPSNSDDSNGLKGLLTELKSKTGG